MFKRILTTVLCLAVMGAAAMAGEPGQREGGRRGERRAQRAGGERRAADTWQLSVQLYTFNRFTFLEGIEKAKSLKLKYIEGFAWHRIGGSAGDAQLNPSASTEARELAKKALRDADIRMLSYYVGDFGKDEAEMRKFFEFAREFGIQVFVCEPKPEQLEQLVKFVREYRVRIAIHNHPKNPKDEKYTNWDPKQAMELVKRFGPRVGACVDTGHLVRSGLDPVESLKAYEDRIVSLHLKDVDKKGPEGHDVPLGTGVGDAKGQLKQLKEQKFAGIVAIEYESNMENNLEDVRKSLDFIRKTAEELGQKVE